MQAFINYSCPLHILQYMYPNNHTTICPLYYRFYFIFYKIHFTER